MHLYSGHGLGLCTEEASFLSLNGLNNVSILLE